MGEKNEALPELEILDGRGGVAPGAEPDPVVPIARVTELAYQGAPEGSGVVDIGGVAHASSPDAESTEPLRLAVLLRPQVPMRQLVAVGPVAAMAVLDALEEQGANPNAVGIAWPHDVVLIDETKLPGSFVSNSSTGQPAAASFSSDFVSLATLTTKAGYADGMFVVLGVGINADALASALPPEDVTKQKPTPTPGESPKPEDAVTAEEAQAANSAGVTSPLALSIEAQLKFARTLQAHLISAMRQWEKNAATPNAQAGPWAPFLQDYFDRVPLLGQAVNVCYPNGCVYARGIFVGIDIWGRATVRTRRAGDIEFPAEKFRIEPQSY